MNRSACARTCFASAISTIGLCVLPAEAGVLLVDSFETAQTSWFTSGPGIIGDRWKYEDGHGMDTVLSNSFSITGDGLASIDLAATSLPTSGTFRHIDWVLNYQNFPAPINIDGSARITISGHGYGSAFGTETPISYPSWVRVQAIADGFFLNGGQWMTSAASEIGNIYFDISGIASISTLRFSFSVLADGGSASFQYDIDQITISSIPAPAAAPLLALAGLTARGRRRK
jgi:hypothetical protein